MPLTGPGDGERSERPTGNDVDETVGPAAGRAALSDKRPLGDAVEDATVVEDAAHLPAIGTLDGGVSRRLVRRCRTAASILLVIGAAFLLVVAIAPGGFISALLTLAAGVLVAGSLLVLARGALWSRVAGSLLPGVAGIGPPREQAGIGSAPSPTIPGTTATIGPPRPLSPGVASAPVKRRLGSAVVPVYTEDGPSPGDGALIVHARADGTLLTEGDTVLVWLAGNGGVRSLSATADGGRTASSLRGRFMLYREADGEVFLATTRLTDTW